MSSTPRQPAARRPRRIDRSSPMPYYHQLKQLIVADIAEHDRQPGDKLPGDHALCAMHDVSRTVVRQALSELEVEGVIVRDKGRGTFVAPAPENEGLIASLTGLYEDVAARGHRLRSEVKKIGVAPADDTQAELLRIDVGDPVVHIERLRFVSDEPWVFAVTDVPYWAAPGLEKEDLTDRSLYQVLEEEYDVQPGARPPGRRGLARRRAHGADAGDPAHRPAAGAAQRLGRRRRPAGRELRGVPPRRPQPVRGRAAPARGPAARQPAAWCSPTAADPSPAAPAVATLS